LRRADPEIEARRLTRFLEVAKYPVVLVSNEVGLGLVPRRRSPQLCAAQVRLNRSLPPRSQCCVHRGRLPLWLKRSS